MSLLDYPTHTLTNYIATPEEYSIQRYEGVSTIYGPYTLPAYIQEYNKLAVALAKASILCILYKFDCLYSCVLLQ